MSLKQPTISITHPKNNSNLLNPNPNPKSIRRYGTVMFNVAETQNSSKVREQIKRRNSVTLDGSALPTIKQTLDSFYEVLDLLGEGVSSQVFLAKNRKSEEFVAVKIIPKKILINNMELAREIAMLKQLSHRYIIGLKDVFITQDHLQIIMEAAEGQELFDEICDRRNFTEKDAREITICILDAMGYLHSIGIAHRDLKPENIMFVECPDGTKKLKIIDFGFARNCDDNNPLYSAAGTLGYKAPEIYNGLPYSTKADMWSIGIIVYILLVGFPPFFSSEDYKDENMLMNAPFWSFFNDETDQLLDSIKEGKVEFPEMFWKDISKDAKDFVQSLLKVNPNERASASEALKHRWIRSSMAEPEPIEETPPQPEKPVEPTSPTLPNKVPDTPTKSLLTPVMSRPQLRSLPSSQFLTKTVEMHRLLRTKTEQKRTHSRLPSVTNHIPELPQLLDDQFIKSGVPELDKVCEPGAVTVPEIEVEAEVEDVSQDDDSVVDSDSDEEVGDTPTNSPRKELSPSVKAISAKFDKEGSVSPKQSLAVPKARHVLTKSMDVNLGVGGNLHEWSKTTTPTWCSCCDEFIWGLNKRPGLKCRKCKAVVHPECKPKMKMCKRTFGDDSTSPTRREGIVKAMSQEAEKKQIIEKAQSMRPKKGKLKSIVTHVTPPNHRKTIKNNSKVEEAAKKIALEAQNEKNRKTLAASGSVQLDKKLPTSITARELSSSATTPVSRKPGLAYSLTTGAVPSSKSDNHKKS